MSKIESIKGYEGVYMISDDGVVYRVKKDGLKALKPHIRNGYPSVILSKNNVKVHFYIHRLVAEAFIPNPNGYRYVNHMDENPMNPTVSNLEWCTNEYNHNYGTTKQRRSESAKRKWQNPEYREFGLRNIREAQRRRWSDG